MKSGRRKAPAALKALRRDMLARIRSAEWMAERERDAIKDRQCEQVRPQSCASWGQILKVMR